MPKYVIEDNAIYYYHSKHSTRWIVLDLSCIPNSMHQPILDQIRLGFERGQRNKMEEIRTVLGLE